MTSAVFSLADNKYCGFSITGHSGYSHAGSDIVCAAVSSAAYLTANLLEASDVLTKTSVEDGKMTVFVLTASDKADLLIKALYEHLSALSRQYPQHVKTAKLKLQAGGK